jgi:hypothetical protein
MQVARAANPHWLQPRLGTATTRRILVGRESVLWTGINWETAMFVKSTVAMRSPRSTI